MSFLNTFFSRVKMVAKKLFGSTTWERTVQSTVTYVAPLLETVVSLTAGSGAEQAVARVISVVQADLATLATVVDAAHSSDPHAGAVAAAALGSVRDNIGSLLDMAAIKNSGKAADIAVAVNLIVGEVDAMLAAMPGNSIPAQAPPAAA